MPRMLSALLHQNQNQMTDQKTWWHRPFSLFLIWVPVPWVKTKGLPVSPYTPISCASSDCLCASWSLSPKISKTQTSRFETSNREWKPFVLKAFAASSRVSPIAICDTSSNRTSGSCGLPWLDVGGFSTVYEVHSTSTKTFCRPSASNLSDNHPTHQAIDVRMSVIREFHHWKNKSEMMLASLLLYFYEMYSCSR